MENQDSPFPTEDPTQDLQLNPSRHDRHINSTITEHLPRRTYCRNFQTGTCTRGNSCWFRHEYDPTYTPRICVYHTRGYCMRGDRCRYSHEEIATDACLQSTPSDLASTSWRMLGPACVNGWYRHVVDYDQMIRVPAISSGRSWFSEAEHAVVEDVDSTSSEMSFITADEEQTPAVDASSDSLDLWVLKMLKALNCHRRTFRPMQRLTAMFPTLTEPQ